MDCKGLKLLFILVLFTALIAELKAYQFNVGGKEGWVVTPSENYNQWAGRMRFQVNDTLFFRYKKGADSVLVVNQGDYDKCNKQNPITTLDGGDSIFKFDRSGPFFFISGTQDHCDKGQKIIIVVLAVRNKSPPGAPTPVVSPPTPASGPDSGPTASGPDSRPTASGPDSGPTPSSPDSGPPPGSGPSGPDSPSTPTVPSSPRGTPGSATSPPPPSAGDIVTPSVILISAVTFALIFIA